jgi:hypothetical protein
MRKKYIGSLLLREDNCYNAFSKGVEIVGTIAEFCRGTGTFMKDVVTKRRLRRPS